MNALLFLLVLVLTFYVAYALRAWGSGRRVALMREPPTIIPTDRLAACQAKLEPLLAITGHRVLGGVIEFEGSLKGPADDVFGRLKQAFAGEPVSPLLLEGEANQSRVVLLPVDRSNLDKRENPRWAVHWMLFFATLATTTWAGALHAGVNLLHEPSKFVVGLPYSMALLAILGTHELGHYFTAKKYGIRVTPPFFIPVPFALGTFGAFIKIKSLPPNRRSLFDVAVAGPLAGLVFAIPALLVGLHYSQVIPGRMPMLFSGAGVNVDSSVLLAILAKLSLGTGLLAGDHLVLHPLAFAGWLGLIVTALNLLPIGQLDGGHMSHSIFGARHAHAISMAAMALLFFLALFVWPGLMFWALIVFFVAGTRDAPAANDVSPVGGARRTVGYLTFFLLLLIIVPVPHTLFEAIGLHSPYL